MEKLTKEQIERLKATDSKSYYDYARYFYVHDLEYYKENFENDIKRRNEINKTENRNHRLIIWGSIGTIFFVLIVLIIISAGDDVMKKSKVENSAWDGSVTQCKKYLKDRLKDIDSYESIEWSEPVQKKDGSYIVTHKYRAKNSFGGYVISSVMFRLNEKGEVTSMEKLD